MAAPKSARGSAGRYVLTRRAEQDLREANVWSRARWGPELTKQYFADLHKKALFLARLRLRVAREDLAAGTGLLIYPVREHSFVYEPLDERTIAIVAVIRQGRDIPKILRKWADTITRELSVIRKMKRSSKAK